MQAAAVEYLSDKTGVLHEDASSWHSRREEDARAKERDLEVGTSSHCIVLVLQVTLTVLPAMDKEKEISVKSCHCGESRGD